MKQKQLNKTSDNKSGDTLRSWVANLKTNLEEDGWLNSSEIKNVANWHDVLCRVLDKGAELSCPEIAFEIKGDSGLLLTQEYMDSLPRVDGKVTDYDLARMSSNIVLPECVEVTPIPENVNGLQQVNIVLRKIP